MQRGYIFRQAKENDITEILAIEEEFFGGYSRSFDRLFLEKWYEYNSSMFYVLEGAYKEVLAFFIFVPITHRLYEKLLAGEVSDMYDFSEADVMCEMKSDYHYVADICVRKKLDTDNCQMSSVCLIKGAATVFDKYARNVVTSPITKDGMRMCTKIGFKKISEEIYEEKIYPIYQLEYNEEVQKRFGRLSKLSM